MATVSGELSLGLNKQPSAFSFHKVLTDQCAAEMKQRQISGH